MTDCGNCCNALALKNRASLLNSYGSKFENQTPDHKPFPEEYFATPSCRAIRKGFNYGIKPFKNWFGDMSDNYLTPLNAWNDIYSLLNHSQKNSTVHFPFYCRGELVPLVKKAGFKNILHMPLDFFSYDPLEHLDNAITIDNPPFSLKYEIFEELLRRGKPFALLLTDRIYTTKKFRELFPLNDKKLQIVSPDNRYTFEGITQHGKKWYKKDLKIYKKKDMEPKMVRKTLCMPCLWYCYGLDLVNPHTGNCDNFIRL